MNKEMNIMYNSYLLVDLDRVRRNVGVILEGLPPGTQMIPVLKDDAYGLGVGPVARVLADIPQLRLFAVSQVGEGLALRRSGLDRDILVMGGTPSFLIPAALEHRLTVAVGRLGLLPVIGAEAAAGGIRARVQIKIETGLHRMGVMPGEELSALLEELRAWSPHVEVTGAFTHFADLENPGRTQRQLERFLQGTQQLADGGFPPALRHISASAASEYWPQYHLDGVRIGRRMYMDHPVRPLGDIQEVASWRSWITNVRFLRAGADLGYGGAFRLERDAAVATIGVGYGDGLNKALVDRHGPVLVGGRRVPLLACCMDQSFVDVTGVDNPMDQEVTLFGWDSQGRLLPSQEVALLVGQDEGCGLISALSGRVQRIYTK